jgi:hypothetical protein
MTQEPTQTSDLPIPSTVLPPPPAALAGTPPLVAGENPTSYDELLARVTATLQPADVVEQMFIREIVDLAWEVHRMRRLKTNLMASLAHEGMEMLLRPLLGHHSSSAALSRAWAARGEDAVSKVEATLAAAGFTMDHVAAATLAARVSDFERIDRMTAYAEVRRNSALRELDMHRSSLALRLRQTLEEIEDAEFEVVPVAEPTTEAVSEVAA